MPHPMTGLRSRVGRKELKFHFLTLCFVLSITSHAPRRFNSPDPMEFSADLLPPTDIPKYGMTITDGGCRKAFALVPPKRRRETPAGFCGGFSSAWRTRI